MSVRLETKDGVITGDNIQQIIENFPNRLAGARFENVSLRHIIFRNTVLTGAHFHHVDLSNATFDNADLSEALFGFSYMDEVHIINANLCGASFCACSLQNLKLIDCDVHHTSIDGCNLHEAALKRLKGQTLGITACNFRNTYLDAPGFTFFSFPDMATMMGMIYHNLPEALTLELMLRDAYASPYPERFVRWAANLIDCPLLGKDYHIERSWYFKESRDVLLKHLKKGKGLIPQMTVSERILALCRHMGWSIRGIL